MLDILKKRLPWPPQARSSGAAAGGRPVTAVEPADPAEPEEADDLPPDWTRLRAPPREQDRCLSPLARAWVAQRQPGFVPRALPQRYPRIMNRLALCWDDPELALRVLDSLLVDARGGRQGFPLGVDLELRVLQQEATELASRPVKEGRAARRSSAAVPGLEHLQLVGEPIDLDDDDGVQWV